MDQNYNLPYLTHIFTQLQYFVELLMRKILLVVLIERQVSRHGCQRRATMSALEDAAGNVQKNPSNDALCLVYYTNTDEHIHTTVP